MHVPWQWIKQRPHFLAEYLSADFSLTLRYKKPLNVKKQNLQNTVNTIGAKGFWQLPLERLPITRLCPKAFRWINRALAHCGIPSFKGYDYVWITSLYFYDIIRHRITADTFLIWDAMDDEIEFSATKNSQKNLHRYLKAERELLLRADIIFCTAEHLAKKIMSRSCFKRDIIIVNNAIELPYCHNQLRERYCQYKSSKNLFMYIGAVAEWFDFDTLINMLEQNPEVSALIVGPHDGNVPVHSRIEYLGTVKRKDIFELMSYATVLMMPFKVTELIESVNPVKLYEYIYGDRIVVAPRYGESEKFEDFIWLYSTPQEFSNFARGVVAGKITKKKNTTQNHNFAEANQWSTRYQIIRKELEP